jgi:hypothetical protein
MTRRLVLSDIADMRAYEAERESFRDHIIALKKRRRVHLGPFISLVFENRDTIRFQIQEMARVERIITDEGIQAELDIYNPLVPEPGRLAATLFLELTSDEQLREWLPKLVGIERSLELRLANGSVVPVLPDEDHQAQLTRSEVTASVHYVHWSLGSADVEAFAEPVLLASTHPAYDEVVSLSPSTIAELRSDLTE